MPGWDPVELEGPEWLDGEKAREDPEAGQERGLRGGGQQSTLDPEQVARAPRRPGAGRSGGPGWAERDVEVRVGGEPRPDMTEE